MKHVFWEHLENLKEVFPGYWYNGRNLLCFNTSSTTMNQHFSQDFHAILEITEEMFPRYYMHSTSSSIGDWERDKSDKSKIINSKKRMHVFTHNYVLIWPRREVNIIRSWTCFWLALQYTSGHIYCVIFSSFVNSDSHNNTTNTIKRVVIDRRTTLWLNGVFYVQGPDHLRNRCIWTKSLF